MTVMDPARKQSVAGGFPLPTGRSMLRRAPRTHYLAEGPWTSREPGWLGTRISLHGTRPAPIQGSSAVVSTWLATLYPEISRFSW